MTDTHIGSIAVVGMSGRFPGAADVEAYWRNLRDGVESVSFFTDDELRRAGVDPAVRQDPRFVGAGGVLADIDLFDAAFFGFGAREAEVMDPQQRLFLECAWEAFENAGYDPGRTGGPVAVFAGTGISTYFFNLYERPDLMALLGGHQIMIGNDKDHLTTHVSYKLDLRGPSVAVQTACSTSLVAVCAACRSLQDFECDMALAGGASVAVPQGRGYLYREGGIASPDGHCRPFDAHAQGTVTGNGIGVVLLKRFQDAVRDRDHIRAVIRGFAVNNDGANKVGYTAPSVEGQAQVIATAQALAGFAPASIEYIEAHGTGTPLGDPIEMAALAQVFGPPRPGQRCAVGSVKANIGHLDTAAGVAGLIKTVLALERRTIPASLHFAAPNPKLELHRTPFFVPARTTAWDTAHATRRAGVSSFGIGGTNAHVVLEEAPAVASSGSSRGAQVLVLSAPTPSALDALARRHADHLRQAPETPLADVAWTLAQGRKPFRYRRSLVCRDVSEAVERLQQREHPDVRQGSREPRHRPVAFMFSGQGAQFDGMAAALHASEAVFRDQLDACLEVLQRRADLDLRDVLLDGARGGEERGVQTALAQPALFCFEYALARLWAHWGVVPGVLLGHSIGEYVAACLAGVFSLDDALWLVAVRGRLMQGVEPGAMLAVGLPEQEVQALLDRELSVAAVNGDRQCVLSGPSPAIDRAAAALAGRGVATLRLRTSHAFHSAMMDPVLEPFARAVEQVTRRAPSIPFLSNVTGRPITAGEAADPGYWARHLRSPVRFSECLSHVIDGSESTLIEVGPGTTLTTLARQHAALHASVVITSHPGARDTANPQVHLLDAVARAWAAGVAIDWTSFFASQQRARLPLPTYPFERKRYWIDPPAPGLMSAEGTTATGREADLSKWFYEPRWVESPSDPPDRLPGRQWLVFDDGVVGASVRQRIEARGGVVTSVVPGDHLQRGADGLVTIRPDEVSDYAAVLRDLEPSDGEALHVVHCWNVTRGVVSFEDGQQRGFFSLLSLANAAQALRPAPRLTVTMVANGLDGVQAADVVQPEKAMTSGLARVIPQEHGNIRVRTFDVGAVVDDRTISALAEECLSPITAATVAMRGGTRWTCEFHRAPRTTDPERSSLLRAGGVYLITGGFGNVGLTIAETLARRCGARLVLLSRTALPERDAWERWSGGSGDEVGSRIAAVRALESLGAEVLPVAADVADEGAMRAAVDAALGAFGALHGVVHAAGATGPDAFQPLAQTDDRGADRHFRPKVQGTNVLARVLAGRELDFCLLTSSLSTVLGGLTFGAYAAANAYLDAFAQARARDGVTPWISIDWDGWRFTQGDGRAPEFFLTPAEGAEAFHRLLSHPIRPRVVVSTGALEPRLRQWVDLESPPVVAAAAEAAPVHERPELDSPFVAPRNRAEQMIAQVWQWVLGVAAVGVHDNFFQLGGHSLLAIQLISRLRELFQTDLGLTALFDRPTIAELAAHLDEMTGDANARVAEIEGLLDYIEQLSPEEVQALLASQGD